ncbi:MAG TPA: DinB family protein [Bryobacteraceae bacterium]|nr:DinB family protein [Bryobacteraceae bacterium]
MANTRKVLERAPDDKLGWKPHPKSGTMAWLGGHLANLPSWATITVNQDSFDVAAPFERPAEPASTRQILELFDKNVAAARDAIAGATDKRLMAPWSLKNGSQVIFTMPRIAVLRSMVMNHLIHHRGQFTIYLRLNDVPVPGLYGPSADER